VPQVPFSHRFLVLISFGDGQPFRIGPRPIVPRPNRQNHSFLEWIPLAHSIATATPSWSVIGLEPSTGISHAAGDDVTQPLGTAIWSMRGFSE
jgi:hypothetical protein